MRKLSATWRFGRSGLPGIAFTALLAACTGGSTGRPFLRVFGGDDIDVGNGVISLPDGGFAVVGYTSNSGAGEDVYLVRTDAMGDTLWTRTFGGAGDDDGWGLGTGPDGGFVMAGFGDSEGAGAEDVLLLATDSNGRLLWRKSYGGTDRDRSWSLAAMSDGGWVVGGETRSRGAGDWDAWVIRTDPAGDSLWTRVLGGPGSDRALSVAVTPSGRVAVSGITLEGDAPERGFVALLSPKGRIEWTSALEGRGAVVAHGIRVEASGTLVVAGYGDVDGNGDNDVLMWRIDPTGRVVSRHRVGGPHEDERAMMSVATGDGGSVAVGYVRGPDGDWESSSWWIDAEGRLLRREVIANPGDDRGVFGITDGRGGLVITGARARGPGGAPDLFLARRLLSPAPGGGPPP